MNVHEQQDIDLLKQKIREEKLSCFEYLKHLDRMTTEQLRSAGYGSKTNAEAMREHFQRVKKNIDKLTEAHIRKYPD